MGSFLNVLILRLPLGKSIVLPRSQCPSCNHLIYWYHNIPIISYFLLKGKCAYCKDEISKQYIIVELISAIITVFLYLKLSISFELLFALIFFYNLIVLSFIDFKYKAVPDYLLLIAFVSSFLVTPLSLIDAFKAALMISGAFVLLNFLISFYIQNIKARVLKDDSLKTQEALGEGDIPILAAIGIILGLKASLVAIFLSSLFAIIPSLYFSYKKKDIQTPYIPYLALGLVVEYFLNLSKVFS
ncbi:prepilin peptidase [Halarcobacter sp.]|nr:prepilin peptidase [Halarcobacter sp.]